MAISDRVLVFELDLKELRRKELYYDFHTTGRKGVIFIESFYFAYDSRQNSLRVDSSLNGTYKVTLGNGVLDLLKSRIPVEIPISQELSLSLR